VRKVEGKGACIIAWGLALLIPAVLVAGIGWPWMQRIEALEREITTGEDQLLRYRRLIATLPALRAELEQVRSNEAVKAFYYDAPTPQLAGAQLQREIQDMVKQAGARLVSAQVLPAKPEEQPPKVSIRTQIQGDTEALFEVLYRIEQARPFLFVDQLSVRSTARRVVRSPARVRGRRTPVRRPPQTQLTVRLDIFGYALGNGR
jgi:general secretion pathway protein M